MKKKGFTLIELLAVIVILAIIMVIAVPQIIKIINSSIESAWNDNVKLIKHAITTNSKMANPTTGTYYTSPQLLCDNETTTDKVVTNNIKTIVKVDSTNIACKKDTDYIFTLNGINKFNGKRATITCKSDGNCDLDESSINQDETVDEDIKCVLATNLSSNDRLGTIGIVSNSLVPGTALDCKIKKTGDYTERFYYVTDLSTDSDYAVLIYNNNIVVSNGKAQISFASGPKYHNNDNYHGPVAALSNLPSISDWDNVSLRFDKRKIVNDVGGDTVSSYTLPSEFSYEGKSARLLTYQEILNACGPNNYSASSSSIDFSDHGYLLNCPFLLDNTCSGSAHGYWLETPSRTTNDALLVYGCYSGENYNYQLNQYSVDGSYDGIRPAIEVKKSQISLSKNLTTNVSYNINSSRNITLPKGKYKLEVWGASGGNDNVGSTYKSSGGYGGYSVGYIDFNSSTTLYVSIGGQGISGTSTSKGGYNGGANGSSGGGGGGATHIATSSGQLKDLSDNRSSILIVAGGGGGSYADTDGNGYNSNGGNGGGYIGTSATQIEGSCTSSCTKYNYPSGGTQENGGIGITSWSSGTTSSTQYVGTFGKGSTGSASHGGGGGGFYGGASGNYNAGGGGSGYLNPSLTNAAMYCYDCKENDTPSIKTIKNNQASETPEPMKSKIGNGYARITFIGEE